MRYEQGHKEATRRRILDVASKRFRKEGGEAVGLAGLMADAGLTHGGFYAHFDSKEALFREAVTDALDRSRADLARIAERGGDGLEAIIHAYLRPRHRDRPDLGCAAASLAAEVARSPEPTRAAFTERIEALIALMAGQLPAGAPAERRRVAIAIFGLMMGALQLARAVTDPDLSGQMLDSAAAAALALGRSCGATAAEGGLS